MESHPHAYRCHVTHAAAESTVDARLGALYRKDRGGAFKEAARVTADSMKGFMARPPKRRKHRTESELLLGDVEQAVKKLESATARQPYARNVDYERLEEIRERLVQALADFDAAYDFGPRVSTQIQEEESMETEGESSPDASSDEGCVDTPSDRVDRQVDSPQVDKLVHPERLNRINNLRKRPGAARTAEHGRGVGWISAFAGKT